MALSPFFLARQAKAMGKDPKKTTDSKHSVDSKKEYSESSEPKKKVPKPETKKAIPKKRVAVKKISDKEKERQKKYRKARKEFMSEPENIKCSFPGCNQVTTEIHHPKGRIGKMLLDKSNMVGFCHTHHQWVHDNDSEAREMGLLKSRHTKD